MRDFWEKMEKNTKMAAILKNGPAPKFGKWIIVFEGFSHQAIVFIKIFIM